MKTNVAMKYQPFKEALSQTASVISPHEPKQKRIEKVLNSNVRILGCGNVKLRQLFCPSNRGAVVVIRRRDGSYDTWMEKYLASPLILKQLKTIWQRSVEDRYVLLLR